MEKGPPLEPLAYDNALLQVEYLKNIPLTKATHKNVKTSHQLQVDNWNKKSIFYFPYWRSLLLRHNLDTMQNLDIMPIEIREGMLDLKKKSF